MGQRGKKWLPEHDHFLMQNIDADDHAIAQTLQRSAHAIACRRVHLAAKMALPDAPLSESLARFRADPEVADRIAAKRTAVESQFIVIPRPPSSPLISMEVLEYMGQEIMQGLGAGYAESIYQHALFNKIVKLDPSAKMEVSIPVVYEGETVGVCRADIVTQDFVIEIKAVRSSVAMAQIRHQIHKYLKHIGGGRQGAVMNFNQEHERLEFHRYRMDVA